MNRRVLFVSHGGGPLPLLGEETHLEMVTCLNAIAAKLATPSAILVISAHWEEPVLSITSAAHPPLIYDYYGFPQEAYEIQYPCSGHPQLAQKIHARLSESGIHARLDEQRGFDHGLFVPLKIMFPDASIPCVQLSLLNNLNAREHLAIGEALSELDFDNLLVLGSGFSFHNLKHFFLPHTPEVVNKNHAFEDWLVDTCSRATLDERERRLRLLEWEKAPFARFCHPREEHLLPMHVCYGITQRQCTEHVQLTVLNKAASMYLW